MECDSLRALNGEGRIETEGEVMEGTFWEPGMGDILEVNKIKIINNCPAGEDSCRAVALNLLYEFCNCVGFSQL